MSPAQQPPKKRLYTTTYVDQKQQTHQVLHSVVVTDQNAEQRSRQICAQLYRIFNPPAALPANQRSQ